MAGLIKRCMAIRRSIMRYWRRELPQAELGWGAFGENLTTEGLNEDELYVGDQLRCRLSIADGDPAAHALLQDDDSL